MELLLKSVQTQTRRRPFNRAGITAGRRQRAAVNRSGDRWFVLRSIHCDGRATTIGVLMTHRRLAFLTCVLTSRNTISLCTASDATKRKLHSPVSATRNSMRAAQSATQKI
jgi:hypothetical protein